MNVSIVGSAIVPFGKSDLPLVELGRLAACAALENAQLDYADVGEVYTTSSLAPPQHALAVAHALGHTAVPVTAIESASAGGLVALREAAWAVQSGRCDVALAIGYEKTTTLTPGGIVPQARLMLLQPTSKSAPLATKLAKPSFELQPGAFQVASVGSIRLQRR